MMLNLFIQVANVLFLEAPACVGFSYDPNDDCRTGDDETSLSNYLALQDFFLHKVKKSYYCVLLISHADIYFF